MKPAATRFLRHLGASVFMDAVIDGFDTLALANAIGREERIIEEIADRAGLTAGQADAAVRELEGAGMIDTIGMVVRLTPSGARWYAAQQGRGGSRTHGLS